MNYSRNISSLSNKPSSSTEQLNTTLEKINKGKRAANIIENENIKMAGLNIKKESKLFK
jgi:hypothetical protein